MHPLQTGLPIADQTQAADGLLATPAKSGLVLDQEIMTRLRQVILHQLPMPGLQIVRRRLRMRQQLVGCFDVIRMLKHPR